MQTTEITVKGLQFKEYISESRIQKRIMELAAAIREKHVHSKPIFLGILNGAFIFAADLVRAFQRPCEITFTRLRSYEGTASSGKVETLLPLNEKLEGRPVIIVEDIVDTGKTLTEFIPELKKLGPASIEVASLFVKPQAMEYPIKVDYAGFNIPPDFIIGYGLDYDGEGRELKAIYQKIDQ